MADENATNVGSITGKLKIDSSNWNQELATAEAKAHQLGRANPTIKVDTAGTAKAVSELSAVEVAEKKVSASSEALARMRAQGRAVTQAQAITEREAVKPIMSFTEWTKRSTEATDADAAAKDRNAAATDRVGASHQNATRPIHLLYSSLAMLAPAVVPLAGFAIAGAGALGMLGAAGILAIAGIKNEIETAAPLADQFSVGLSTLKEQFLALSRTSAVAMLGSFNQTIALLDSHMPSLNRQTDQYSRLLGSMGTNTLAGLLGSFKTLNPVFQAFTTYLHDLTAGLSTMGSSDGLRRFGDYALAIMPRVIETIHSLISGVSALLQALAPLGNIALTSLKVIGDILTVLPTDVLTVLVAGALGTYAAFSAWSVLIPIIKSFGIMLNVSLGPIGLVVAGVGMLVGMLIGAAASTDKATGATIGYTSALEQDTGAIGENVRAHAAQEIAKSKAAESAGKLGINLGLLTDAAIGNKDAQAQLNGELGRLDAKAKSSTGLTNEMGGANVNLTKSNMDVQASVKSVREELTNQNSALNASVEQQKRFQEAMAGTNVGTSAQRSELSILAGMYGTTVASVLNAEAAQKTAADQLANTTLQMQLQNNAAGILQGTLDSLNGKAISAAQAQNAFDSALANMGTHVDKTGKQITFTTTSISDMSAASVALRGQLNTQISSLQSVVEANGGLSNSTGEAKAQMEQMRQQIIDNAVAHGVDKDAVTAYVDKLLKIPASIPPTKLDVDTAAAEAKLAYLARHRTTTITAITNQVKGGGYADDPSMTALDPAQHANGGVVKYLSSGGFAQFIPSGTDTVPAMLTPEEFVMKRSSSRSIGPEALNYMNETGRIPGGTVTVNLVLDGQIIDTRIVDHLGHVSRQVGGMRR